MHMRLPTTETAPFANKPVRVWRSRAGARRLDNTRASGSGTHEYDWSLRANILYASCAFLTRASSSARLFSPVRSPNMPRCASIDRGMVTARTTSHGPVKLMPKAETHKISLITPTIMIRLEYHNCTTTMI